jgi:prophage regulatory protein
MAEKILRLPAVLDATGLCQSAVYAAMRAGSFPQNVALGLRSVGWRESEILGWIESREIKRPRLAEAADDRACAR